MATVPETFGMEDAPADDQWEFGQDDLPAGDVLATPGQIRDVVKQTFVDEAIPLPDGRTAKPTEYDRLRAARAAVKLPDIEATPEMQTAQVAGELMRSNMVTRKAWLTAAGIAATAAAKRIAEGEKTQKNYLTVAAYLEEARKVAEEYDQMPFYQKAAEGIAQTLGFASGIVAGAPAAQAMKGTITGVAPKVGEKVLEKSAPGIGRKLIGELAGESARLATSPSLQAMVVEDAVSRMAPKGVTAEGLVEGDPFIKAFSKAAGSSLISLLTERSGGQLYKLPGMARLKAILGGNRGPIRTEAEWDGILGEWGEERLDELAQGIFSGVTGDGFQFGPTADVLSGDPERTKRGLENLAVEGITIGAVSAPAIASDIASNRQRAQGLANWKQGGSATQAITGVQDNAVEGIAALDAPPGAHKWAEIVLGDRKRFKEAPDEATRQKQWEDIQKEISDAEQVEEATSLHAGDSTRMEAQIPPGTEQGGGGGIRGGGQEGGQVPGQGAKEAEVQVAPTAESPDVEELKRMTPEALVDVWRAAHQGLPVPPPPLDDAAKDEMARQIVAKWGGTQDTTQAVSELNAFAEEIPSAAATNRVADRQDTGPVPTQAVKPVEPETIPPRPAVPAAAPTPAASEPSPDASQPEGQPGVVQETNEYDAALLAASAKAPSVRRGQDPDTYQITYPDGKAEVVRGHKAMQDAMNAWWYTEAKRQRKTGAGQPKGREEVASPVQQAAQLQKDAGRKLPSRNAVEEILGKTIDQQTAEEYMVSIGVDEITAADEALTMHDAHPEGIPTRSVVVHGQMLVNRADAKGRLADAVSEAGDARIIEFSKTGSDVKYTIHPSTYEGHEGEWQLTRTDERGASGHQNFKTKEEAIGAAIGAHPTNSYFNEGDADYKISRLIGKTEPPSAPQTPVPPTMAPEPPQPTETQQETPQEPEQAPKLDTKEIARKAVEDGQNIHTAIKAAGLKIGSPEYRKAVDEVSAETGRLRAEAEARKPENLAERAARGEAVERPEDVSPDRWDAMVKQKAKSLGIKPKEPSVTKPEATIPERKWEDLSPDEQLDEIKRKLSGEEPAASPGGKQTSAAPTLTPPKTTTTPPAPAKKNVGRKQPKTTQEASDDAYKRLKNALDSGNILFQTEKQPPKAVDLIAEVIRAEINNNVNEFDQFVQNAVAKLGEANVQKLGDRLGTVWDHVASMKKGMGKSRALSEVLKPKSKEDVARQAKLDSIPVVSNDQIESDNWDQLHAGLGSEQRMRQMAVGMEGIENREYGIREHSPGNWQVVSRAKRPSRTELIDVANQWRYLAAKASEGLDKKQQLEHMRKTTKADLDRWLQRQYGLSETEARDISNAAGQEQDFVVSGGEAKWTKKGVSPPTTLRNLPWAQIDAADILYKAGLNVRTLPDGTWEITGNTYDNRKEIGDVKREQPDLGGWFHSNEKKWTFKRDPRRAIADRINRRGTKAQPADASARAEQMAREDARRREDERPDVQRTSDDYRAIVGQDTKSLIERGLKHDISQEVVDNQIEDIGRVVDAAENGRPLFIVGSAPGTGKTFVLGGVIRELRKRGFRKFVYVTQNQNLISQVQRNLADYGLDGVEFTTYSKIQKSPADTGGRVLLLDEAHSAKNTERDTGKAVGNMVSQSQFTVFSTATPFENVTEAEYLSSSGIFDDLHVEFERPSRKSGGRPFRNVLHGFDAWAWMFGSNVYFVQRTNRNGEKYMVPVLWWPKHHTAEADQIAANEWLKQRGVFTQRPMMLPPGTVVSNMSTVTADKFWADISNEVVQIYADAEQNAESDVEKGQIVAHKVNILKRLLEAAKVDAAIAEARKIVGEGREEDPQVVIFVNTKKDLNLGSFQLSAPYRKEHGIKGKEAMRRYKPAEMDQMMQRWYEAREAAEAMGEGRASVGPPPFARFIHKIAMAFDQAGVLKRMPSVIETIMEAFPGQSVEFSGNLTDTKNAANLTQWLENRAKVIVATMDKGGTGLSYHDTTGEMPDRYQINMNLPWSGTKVDQVSGRLARLGTAKPVHLTWLFADNIPFDRELSRTVGSRMRSMGAAVEGREKGDASQIKNFDFSEPETDARDEDTAAPVSREQRIQEMQDSFGITREQAEVADILYIVTDLARERMVVAPPGTPIPEGGLKQISKAAARMAAEGKTYTTEEEFFAAWDKALKAVKGKRLGLKSTQRAVDDAIEDIAEWLESNPQYRNYYTTDNAKERAAVSRLYPELQNDADWAFYKIIGAIASNSTNLSENITEQIDAWGNFRSKMPTLKDPSRLAAEKDRRFDVEIGRGVRNLPTLKRSAFPLHGGAQAVKAQQYLMLNQIVKEQGGVEQAVQWLLEAVPAAQIRALPTQLGVGALNGKQVKQIKDTVEAATGQSQQIPRIFAFGPKLGAYAMNHLGRSEYTTIDVWESRFWRSFFKNAPQISGLETDTAARSMFKKAGNAFAEQLGLSPSEAQAIRWYYIIQKVNEAGYTKARSNETISAYAERAVNKRLGEAGAPTSGKGKTAKPETGRRSSTLRDLLGDTIFGEVTPDTLLQTAFHGSKHKFSRFTLDHIGSGEGAQAYGWGLYFADSREVADFYRDATAQPFVKKWNIGSIRMVRADKDGNAEYYDYSPRSSSDRDVALAAAIEELFVKQVDVESAFAEGGVEAARAKARQVVEEQKDLWRTEWPDAVKHADALLRMIDKRFEMEIESPGAIYQVDLVPDQDDYLLWDKPMSEQSEKVKKELSRIAPSDLGLRFSVRSKRGNGVYLTPRGTQFGKEVDSPVDNLYDLVDNSTGMTFYYNLAAQRGVAESAAERWASEFLAKHGIRGMKYLDQGSRSKGEGSYNYVIFDADDITIQEVLYQKQQQRVGDDIKGWTHFVNAAKAIIGGTELADISTFIHEFAHPMRRFLFDRSIPAEERGNITDEDIQTIEDFCGVKEGEWTRDAEETFAKGWETYWMEGKAPNAELETVFQKIARWMAEVYGQLKELVGLTPEVRAVFDKVVQRGQIPPGIVPKADVTAGAEVDTTTEASPTEDVLDDVFADVFGEESAVEPASKPKRVKPPQKKTSRPNKKRDAKAESRVVEHAISLELETGPFLAAAREAYETLLETHERQRDAKRAAHQVTGLNALDMQRLRNAKYDYGTNPAKVGGITGERLRHFDVQADSVAKEYPDVFDVNNASQSVWDVLNESASKPLSIDSPDVLRAAESLYHSAKLGEEINDARQSGIAVDEINQALREGAEAGYYEVEGHEAEIPPGFVEDFVKEVVRQPMLFEGDKEVESAVAERDKREEFEKQRWKGDKAQPKGKQGKFFDDLNWRRDQQGLFDVNAPDRPEGPGTLFQSQQDHLRQAAQLAKAALEGGVTTFEDYIAHSVQQIGKDKTIQLARAMEGFWDYLRKKKGYEHLGPVGNVAGILQPKAEVPRGSRVTGTRKPPSPIPPKEKPSAGLADYELTGMAKAVMNDLRELASLPELGAPPAETIKQWVADAAVVVAADPTATTRLLNEIISNPARALDQHDVMLLAFRYRELANQIEPHFQELVAASESGDSARIARARTEFIRVRQPMTEFEELTLAAKSTWGRTGVALQVLMRRDFSEAGLLRRAREANHGQPLTPEQEVEMRQMAAQIAELQKKLDAEIARADKAEAELASKKHHSDTVKGTPPRKKPSTEQKAALDKAWEKIAKAANVNLLFQAASNPFDETVQIYRDIGVTTFAELRRHIQERLGQDQASKLEGQFKQAWENTKPETEVDVQIDMGDLAALTKEARRIERDIVEGLLVDHSTDAVIEMRDKIIDDVHAEMQILVGEDFTRRQTMDALDAYGQFSRPSQDTTEKLLRELNAEILKLSQIDQMAIAIKRAEQLRSEGLTDEQIGDKLIEEGLLVKPTGLQRDTPTDRLRRLTSEYNELKKEIPASTEGRAGLLQTAVAAIERAMGNRIRDLNYAIDHQEPIKVGRKQAPTTPKIEEMKTERDRLLKTYREMFPPERKKLTPEQRLANAIKAVEREIAVIEKQLETRNFDKPQQEALPDSPELAAVRSRLERLRAQRDAAKALELSVWEGEGGSLAPENRRQKLSDAEKQERQAQREIERIQQQLQDLKEGKEISKTKRPDLLEPELRQKLTIWRNRLKAAKEAAKETELQSWEGEGGALAPDPKEAAYRKAYMASLRNRIAKYQRILDEGDFAPKEKKLPRKLSSAELDLKRQLADKRHKVLEKMAEYHLAHLKGVPWAADKISEALHLARAIETSFDLSALLRQGGLPALGHPNLARKALLETVASIAYTFDGENALALRDGVTLENVKKFLKTIDSEKAEMNFMHQLTEGDWAEFRILAGLDLPSSDQAITRQEEVFQGRWGKLVPGVAVSSRLYTMILNKMRADLFDMMVDNLGRNRQVTLAEAKLIADFINVVTGRSSAIIWNGRDVTAMLNLAFFAPRYVASRFQYIAMPFYLPFKGGIKADWQIKRAIYKEYGRTVAGIATVLGIIAIAGQLFWDDDDEDKPTVEWKDWTVADFLKVKMGETRLDFLAGLQQIFVLSARMLPEWMGGGRIGDRKFGEGGPYAQNRASVLTRFARTKLAPGPGYAVTAFNDWEDVVGNKADRLFGFRVHPAIGTTAQLFQPLALRDVSDAFRNQSVPMAITASMLSIMGVGMSTYGPKTKYMTGTPEERQKQFEKDLDNMEWDSDAPAYSEFLTADQMKQVTERIEERKQSTVSQGLMPEPERKLKDTDTSYQKKLDTRAKAQAKLQEMIKALDLDHSEAQLLLVQSYRKPDSKGKMQTEVNADDTTKFDASYWGDAKNPGKAKILAKLYGYSDPAAAVREFRQSPEFKAWLTEWNRKQKKR